MLTRVHVFVVRNIRHTQTHARTLTQHTRARHDISIHSSHNTQTPSRTAHKHIPTHATLTHHLTQTYTHILTHTCSLTHKYTCTFAPRAHHCHQHHYQSITIKRNKAVVPFLITSVIRNLFGNYKSRVVLVFVRQWALSTQLVKRREWDRDLLNNEIMTVMFVCEFVDSDRL